MPSNTTSSVFFYTYVLESLKDSHQYIGFTNHLKRRIEEHNKAHREEDLLVYDFQSTHAEKMVRRLALEVDILGMHITWFGQSCFRVQGESASLLFDPFKSEEVGLKLPKIEADAVLLTRGRLDRADAALASGEPFVIDGPGEYEIGGAMIYGIPAFSNETEKGSITIYIVKLDGMTVCHLGDLGQKELTDEQIEKIGNIDVLFIPVGVADGVGAKEARNIVNQIEPRVVIPMRYALPGLKLKLEKVDGFLKEIGGATRTVEGKLTVKKKDLLQEGMEVILLKIPNV